MTDVLYGTPTVAAGKVCSPVMVGATLPASRYATATPCHHDTGATDAEVTSCTGEPAPIERENTIEDGAGLESMRRAISV